MSDHAIPAVRFGHKGGAVTKWMAWKGPLTLIAIALVAGVILYGVDVLGDEAQPRAAFVAAPSADPAPPVTSTSGPAEPSPPAAADGTATVARVPGVPAAGAPEAAASTPGPADKVLVSPPTTMPDVAEETTNPPPPAPPVIPPMGDHPAKPMYFDVVPMTRCENEHNEWGMTTGGDVALCTITSADSEFLWRVVVPSSG